jgi:hypothetical protein
MPRALLVQVKRQILRFEFRQYFWFASLQRLIHVAPVTRIASTSTDSWLKWAVSFHEESRARHFPAQGDR